MVLFVLALSTTAFAARVSVTPTQIAVERAADTGGTRSFTQDIAPLVVRCCLSCHRVGGPGAYPLETAAQIKRVARTMLEVIDGRTMPPWLPVGGVAHRLERPSDEEISRVRAWVEAGAMIDPETRDVALAPRAADNASALAQWRIGEGWTIGATESRVMRSFQVVSDIERDLLIGGWRMAPDEPGLVSMTLIASGDASLARALDERDASVGFRFTGDLGVRPAASLAGFGVEGRFMLPEGFAMRVARGDALTFEMHADGRGRDESGAASIEALAPRTDGRGGALRLVEPLVVSAQGAARQTRDAARMVFEMPPLERDLDLAAIVVRPGPYGVKVLLTAEHSARTDAAQTLLRIDRYSVHLDRPYVVDPSVRLPRGTVLSLEVVSENETLAARSTPQAVLLVADAAVEVARAPVEVACHENASARLGVSGHAFLQDDATVLTADKRLRATALVPAAVFAEVMGYESEPRTGPTNAAGMSWFEAVDFANCLSERSGLRVAYAIEFPQRDGGRLVGGVVRRMDGDGWRLPEKGEWELLYAARPELTGVLWNWTFENEGDQRVVRGGCWADNPGTQGITTRSSVPPATRNELFGVRLVRNIADHAQQ